MTEQENVEPKQAANVVEEIVDASAEAVVEAKLKEVSAKWGWVLAGGLITLIMGFVGLNMSIFMALVMVKFVGVMLVFAGILGVVSAAADSQNRWFSVLTGILYMLGGSFVVNTPLQASALLAMFVGISILVSGFLRIALSIRAKQVVERWGLILVSGVLSVILGFMILTRWPAGSLQIIGILIAFEMILHGWSNVMLAMAGREYGKQHATG